MLDFSHNHCVAQKTVNNTIVKPLNNCIALLASRMSDPSRLSERNFSVSKVLEYLIRFVLSLQTIGERACISLDWASHGAETLTHSKLKFSNHIRHCFCLSLPARAGSRPTLSPSVWTFSLPYSSRFPASRKPRRFFS